MEFESGILKIEKAIGYTFRDKSLLKQAFTRTSYCNEHRTEAGEALQSNEVLEFFGDSVLSCAIISLLLKGHTERYSGGIKTKLDEGDFSIIKSRLSDKKNLSRAMAEMGLQVYLLLGEGDAKQGTENEPSVMEDLFESIVGAIYIDSGENIAKVIKSVSKMLDASEYLKNAEAPRQNPKNALQEWCQDKRHRLPMPEYRTLDEQEAGGNQKIFVRGCFINDKLYGRGIGKNQKLADVLAAEEALRRLEAEFVLPEANTDAISVMQRLREIAKQNKKPSPEFRDLGESKNSREGMREFIVECRFMDKVTEATGFSKKDARERSAARMLELFSEGEAKEKKQSKPRFTRKSPKSPVQSKSKKAPASEKNPTRVPTKPKNTKKRQG